MTHLTKLGSKQIRNSTIGRAAFGAIVSSLLLGLAACSSESGGASEAKSAEVAHAAAAQVTTDSLGVSEWVAFRDADTRALVIEGRDGAGNAVTMVESRGGAHMASLRVDSDGFEVSDAVGVVKDTLSAHSLDVIARVKADLEGTPAADALLVPPTAEQAGEIGTAAQAATTKPTTTTANCVACWIMTVGTGAEFCYKWGHCDN